jgi:hypothetical protein
MKIILLSFPLSLALIAPAHAFDTTGELSAAATAGTIMGLVATKYGNFKISNLETLQAEAARAAAGEPASAALSEAFAEFRKLPEFAAVSDRELSILLLQAEAGKEL